MTHSWTHKTSQHQTARVQWFLLEQVGSLLQTSVPRGPLFQNPLMQIKRLCSLPALLQNAKKRPPTAVMCSSSLCLASLCTALWIIIDVTEQVRARGKHGADPRPERDDSCPVFCLCPLVAQSFSIHLCLWICVWVYLSSLYPKPYLPSLLTSFLSLCLSVSLSLLSLFLSLSAQG